MDSEFQNDAPTSSRRGFFASAIYLMGAIIAAGFALPAAAYLLLPRKKEAEEEWVDAGSLSQLNPGTPTEVSFRRNRLDAWKLYSEINIAWAVKQPGGGVVAFGSHCTHLGCVYHWDEGKRQFLCPCHNSLFDIDGRVISGPAPRPLDRYDVKVDGNKFLLGQLRESPESKA